MSSNAFRHTLEETITTVDNHTKNYKISWIIPKFKLLMQSKTMARSLCDRISTVTTNNSKFYLKMSFHGRKNESFDIHFMSLNKTIFLKYTIKLNIFYTSLKTVDYHKVEANKWQHCATYETDKIYRQCADTSLQIIFNFQDSQETLDANNIIPTTQLSKDFENLLTDGSYSDVTMKSSEGVEFKVHKNIISIRSKVLKAHFEHSTSESITNIVETAWETEVLREVLTFVYTDKSPRIKEFPEKLLAAADYYQLERLKRICEVELTKRLTVENAIDTLQLAELHLAYCLEESTLGFIKNEQSLVIESQGWIKIQSVKLIKRIHEYIVCKKIVISDILTCALKEISSK